MKKLLLALALLLVVLLVAAGVAGTFFLGRIVTAGINHAGPQLTQTRLELASADISPFNGTGTLNQLFVGNPQGWSGEKLASVGTVHVDVEPMSLFGDHIVVRDVLIEQPEFIYETRLVSSNLQDFIKNIEEATGGGTKDPTAEPGKEPVKIEVRRFRLTGAKVTIMAATQSITVPVPDIELTDLGTGQGGLTPAQLTLAVARQLTTKIIAAAADAWQQAGGVGASASEKAKDLTRKAGEGLKSLLNRKPDQETDPKP